MLISNILQDVTMSGKTHFSDVVLFRTVLEWSGFVGPSEPCVSILYSNINQKLEDALLEQMLIWLPGLTGKV